MARTNSDDLLMEDDLAAAFLGGDEEIAAPVETEEVVEDVPEPSEEEPDDEEWENTDEFPGQLAVDVYETADKLVVKARTAGISKSDLDVSISDNILTISGILLLIYLQFHRHLQRAVQETRQYFPAPDHSRLTI